MSLKDEIKQNKPFVSEAQEAVLNIVKTADKLDTIISSKMKEFNLTSTQYNVLRILKGAGANGWSCSEISIRMLKKDPDITRLLDRLEKRDLIKRERDKNDRRSVRSYINKKGLELVNGMGPKIEEQHNLLQKKMGAKKLKQLINLLEEIRLLTDI